MKPSSMAGISKKLAPAYMPAASAMTAAMLYTYAMVVPVMIRKSMPMLPCLSPFQALR